MRDRLEHVGSLPPLELRSVATLLTLTDRFIDGVDNFVGPAIDFSMSCPSSITRKSGSVPE